MSVESVSPPPENPFRFDDPTAQRISDMWHLDGLGATTEQKNTVGRAFIIDVLGLNDEMVESFEKRKGDIDRVVGMKQASISDVYTEPFWKKVIETFPGEYSEEDLGFLIDRGRIGAVLQFLEQLEPLNTVNIGHPFSLLVDLRTTAIAYK